MANNVMREIGIVMGTWYVDFCVDTTATAPEMAHCRESNLDLTWRESPRQWRQKSFLLRLELALVFPEEEGMMQQSSVSISLSF